MKAAQHRGVVTQRVYVNLMGEGFGFGAKMSSVILVKVDKSYVQFDLSSYCLFPIVLSGGSSYV